MSTKTKVVKTDVTNSVSCPTCKARKGVSCKSPSGNRIADHKSRLTKYNKTHGPIEQPENNTPGFGDAVQDGESGSETLDDPGVSQDEPDEE